LMYRGEYLAGYAGETVSLRFDPTDITTVLVYRQENKKDVFLTRAYAQGLETEQLSLEEAKASSRRIRQAGKSLSNEAILQEALERDALIAKKKSRKDRQKEEQKLVRSQPAKLVKQEIVQRPEPESVEVEPEIEIDLGTGAFTPIDFDDLRSGW
jgi:putative transposase